MEWWMWLATGAVVGGMVGVWVGVWMAGDGDNCDDCWVAGWIDRCRRVCTAWEECQRLEEAEEIYDGGAESHQRRDVKTGKRGTRNIVTGANFDARGDVTF